MDNRLLFSPERQTTCKIKSSNAFNVTTNLNLRYPNSSNMKQRGMMSPRDVLHAERKNQKLPPTIQMSGGGGKEKSATTGRAAGMSKVPRRGHTLPVVADFDQSTRMKISEQNTLLPDIDGESFNDFSKTRVECICPKCGKRHMLQFHWSGKGIPRKYCRKCI
jgi:hypothetical protein